MARNPLNPRLKRLLRWFRAEAAETAEIFNRLRRLRRVLLTMKSMKLHERLCVLGALGGEAFYNMDVQDRHDKFLPAILSIISIDVKNVKKGFA